MVKRPLGATGVGLLPRSNTRRTVARGYPSDYDGRSHQREESKPSGSTKDNEAITEDATLAEIEVVENRDRNHGRAVTDNAVSATLAPTTCNSTMTVPTEKDSV